MTFPTLTETAANALRALAVTPYSLTKGLFMRSYRPVSNPTALQINNTRMRALVKCIAMCGLGVEVYSGEDVPDKGQDSEAVSSVRKSTSARAEIIEEMNLTDADWATVAEWADKVREIVPTKEIYDLDALEPVYKDIQKLGDLAVAVSHVLESFQRTALRKVRDRLNS